MILRLLVFELKGLASLGWWLARRRHGVPPGATPVSYSRGQTPVLVMFLFLLVLELVAVEVLLRALGTPSVVRTAFLALDAYGIFFCLGVIAACVTRPHVITADEVRIRYGGFFDLRVPRNLVATARQAVNRNERGTVRVADGVVVVSVFAETNLVFELTEPVLVRRPLGRLAFAWTIRCFADDPEAALAALRADVSH